MNDLKFNNLLKIKLNIEGDSGDKYNIPFNPRMLFYDDKIPANINTEGLLMSDTINMASGQSSSSRWQQPGSSQENECPNDNMSISDIEVLKKNLNQSVNRVNDKNLQSFFNYRNSRSSYGYGSSSNNNNVNNNGQILDEDKINKNIKFITCLFFKIKQTFLRLNDNSIYLITNCRTSDYDINNVEHTQNYDRVYNITLNLTLLDVFKPAYLILKLNYLDILTKKQQTTVFLPSMNEPEITDLPLMENKEVSVLFSPFVELDQSFIATPTKDKKRIFLNKVEMTNWIIDSFRKNKKLYTWEDYKRKVLNNNLRFLKQVFFSPNSPLDIEDKEYKVEKVLDNNSSSQNLNFPVINTNNELVLEYTYTLALKDTTKNELINLDIKLQIDNSLLTLSAKKKLNKTLLLFTPRLVNKNIPVEDNKVFFIPYLEIPPVYQLKKLNENIMRLFTVPTEFLKLVAYLKEKNQLKKLLDLKNPADKQRLDVIVNKNIERMLEIFLQPNSELYLDREVMNKLDNKTPSKEEKKFFISRSTLIPSQTIPPQQLQSANKLYTYSKEVNDFSLPLRYAIEVKIELAENKLMLLDFYKLACKDKTKNLDEKIDQVILSAYPNEPITKPSTFFTELMKPDQPYETLNRMRPALISTTTTGGTGKRKRGVIIKKGRVTYRKAVNKRNKSSNKKRMNRKTRKL